MTTAINIGRYMDTTHTIPPGATEGEAALVHYGAATSIYSVHWSVWRSAGLSEEDIQSAARALTLACAVAGSDTTIRVQVEPARAHYDYQRADGPYPDHSAAMAILTSLIR